MSTDFISAVPIIPAREVEQSAAWYRDRLGFTIFHTENEYGIVGRGETWIHFWGPSGIPPEKSETMIRSASGESTSCTSTAGRRRSSIRTPRSRRSPGASGSSQSPTTTATS